MAQKSHIFYSTAFEIDGVFQMWWHFRIDDSVLIYQFQLLNKLPD